MSECIRINSVENLPVEQTLLIHYTILCTGTWELAQLLTAYRNVCEDSWTVMYPNYQHPRHSDFPIVVTYAGTPATFAWNYGGIQGISAENFDESHSYLTQLSIFNYNCYFTGQEPEPSGTGTGQDPQLPGMSGEPPITGSSGGGGGSPRTPSGPTPPNPGNGTPPLGNSKIQNNSPASDPPRQDPRPSGIIFGSNGVSNLSEIIDPTIYRSTNRTINPNLELNSIVGGLNTQSVSPEVIGSIQVPYGAYQQINTVDPGVSSPEQNIGRPLGRQQSLTTQSPGISIENSISLRQVDTRFVIPNSFTYLELGNDEVVIGSPAVVSGTFTTPVGVEVYATAQLYILAADNTVRLLLQTEGNVTESTPLQIGSSIATNNYNLGSSTLILLIKNSNNQIIGVSSRVLVIRAPIQTNNRSNLPPILNQALGISPSTTPLNSQLLGSNIILNNNGQLSVVVVGDTSSVEINNINNLTYSGGQLINNSTPLAYSEGAVVVDGSEIQPNAYSVGTTTTSNGTSIVSIISNTKSDIYLSSNAGLQSYSSSESNFNGTTASVSITCPFAAEPVKLIVHGYVSGVIDPAYTLYSSETNLNGTATFNNVAIQPEQYYSLVLRGDGTYNPFRYIVHTFIYD